MRKNHVLVKTTIMVFLTGILMAAFVSGAFAKPGDEKLEQKAAEIAEKTGTEAVKTIRWQAKLTKTIKASILETDEYPGGKVKLNYGQKITVVQRDYHEKYGISECELKDGRRCWVANKYLYFAKPLATGAKGDYDRATKEAFVNGMKIKERKGDKLIWISLDKQRVNVFQGSQGNWELIQEFKCSTGKPDSPTFDQTFKKVYKIQKKQHDVQYGDHSRLYFYSFVYGYGIHKWPGSGRKKYIGKEPVSSSCIRLSKKNALWIYDDDNIPVGTRVYVW